MATDAGLPSTVTRLRVLHASRASYDHRLVRLVQETGDATIATGIGVPRSTVAGWLRCAPQVVTTAPGLDASAGDLRARVAKPERRLARLKAVLHLLIAVFRLLQPDLTRLRIPNGCDKGRLLPAIDRSRRVLVRALDELEGGRFTLGSNRASLPARHA